jgi:hypothetical protein
MSGKGKRDGPWTIAQGPSRTTVCARLLHGDRGGHVRVIFAVVGIGSWRVEREAEALALIELARLEGAVISGRRVRR